MMGPMMGPMMGGAPPPGGSTGSAREASAAPRPGGEPKPGYRPDLVVPGGALADFGAERRGLPHATDNQYAAATMVAALVRQHDRMAVELPVAVGLSGSQAVFATADGLSFLWPGVKAPANLTPLVTAVPDRFVRHWMGCSKPWRPLIAAAEMGLIAPLDSVVGTDPSAGQEGVLVLSPAEVDEVNAAPATRDRYNFDAIDIEDVDDAFEHLTAMWGRPGKPPDELAAALRQFQWTTPGPSREHYIVTWMHYLLAMALTDLQYGNFYSARYVLRNALRVPVPAPAVRP